MFNPVIPLTTYSMYTYGLIVRFLYIGFTSSTSCTIGLGAGTYSWWGDVSGDKKYAVGTININSFIKSEIMVNQVSMISLWRGSSQVNMACQIP